VGFESTAQFIGDLVQTNPPTTDSKQQGDDHLRLLKKVLQTTFPNANKAIYFPDSSVKSASFSVLATQMNVTFMVSTASGDVTMTLPALLASDAGWLCTVVKSSTDSNAVFVAPASGNVQSGPFLLTKTRRGIPGVPCRIVWTGSSWIVERAVGVPVGSIVDFDGNVAPVGYVLPNGQTLAGTGDSNFPDYFAAKGSLTTRDITGRTVAMKEAVATRLTVAGSGIDGATLGAAGGAQSVAIAQTNLPAVTLTTTIGVGQGSHSHGTTVGGVGGQYAAGGGSQPLVSGSNATSPATLPEMTGTTPLGGSGTPINDVQPTIVLNKILVVE
jgi:hypothetical protein